MEPARIRGSSDGLAVLYDPSTLGAGARQHREAPHEDAPYGGILEPNLAAIRTLREIQKRPDGLATDEEKKILAGYRGWGGMGEIFNRYGNGLHVERAKVREVMTDDEYAEAGSSIVSAFYTPDDLIRASWDAVNRLGFDGGRVLDPSAGIGRYEGALPDALRPYTKVTAVEIDGISADITKALYPQSEVIHSGFQDANLPRDSFDLAISNVPFANHKVTGKDYDNYQLHDYCIMRSVDKVRPGGLVCVITTRSTLDNQNPSFRQDLSEKVDMVAAYRLPASTFDKSANAKVVSDLIIFRKKDETPFIGENFAQIGVAPLTLSVKSDDASHTWDRERSERQSISGTDEKPQARINSYFLRHPENVIGYNALEKGRFGNPSYTVMPIEDRSVVEVLRERMAALPHDVVRSGGVASQSLQIEMAREGEREGTYSQENNRFYQIQGGQRVNVDWLTTRNYGDNFDKPITAAEAADRQQVAAAWFGLRDQATRLFKLENTPGSVDAVIEVERRNLGAAYDRYVNKYGTLNRAPGKTHLEKARFLEDDPEYPLVLALEDEVKHPGDANNVEYVKGRIFSERLRQPTVVPEKANDLEEAINISMGFYQSIQPARVASLLGIDVKDAVTKIEESGRAYLNPETSLYESSEKYLSGNVYNKLTQARRAAAEHPRYQRNVDALVPVQPERIPLGNIYAQLSSRWIPTQVLSAFASEKFGGKVTVNYSPSLNAYEVQGRGDGTESKYSVLREHITEMRAPEVLTHALNGTDPSIFIREHVNGQWVDVRSAVLSQAASQMVERFQQEFQSWLPSTDAVLEFEGKEQAVPLIVEEIYNRTNNAMVEPKYTGDNIPLVGATSYVFRSPHRMSAISRILQDQCGVMAHGVGSGKTLTTACAVMELNRLNMARHPWVVVQKQTIGQFAREWRRAYPDANLLIADEKNFTAKNRQRFLARASTRKYDAVIVTQPQFDLIMASPSAAEAYYTEQVAMIDDESFNGLSQRDKEKAKKRIEARLKKMTQAIEKRQDKIMSFEDTGADFVFIDEAHAYKRIPIVTKLSRVKGIPNTESQRATSTMVKLRSIQSRFNGRHVVLATGTPLTNTMAEAYVMLSLASPNVLKNYKIKNFDDFAHTFGVKVSKVEHSWSGSWKMVTRFNRFVNGNELITMIRSGFDVRMGNKELGLKVPEMRGGGPELVIIKPTPSMQKVNQWVQRLADTYEQDDKKAEFSWIPIATMGAGVAAALDPRLVQPELPDEPGSKINCAVSNILDIYKETRKDNLTQLVFCDRFRPMQIQRLADYAAGRPADEAIEGLSREEGVDETSSSPEAEEAALVRQEESDYKAGGFNLYHEIRSKLIAGGVPADKIAIIHDFNTDVKRTRLFEDMNAGRVSILLGSTEKAGVGVNVQEKLYAAHHLDPPRMMTPAMVEQRNGRIIRQGNPLAEVRVIYYGMESSMDTGIYQMLESKQKFIVQALSGQAKVRQFDDAADEVVVSMSEMKARLTGDPRVVEKVELEQSIREMRSIKLAFDNQKGARVRHMGDIRQQVAQGERDLVVVQKSIPALKGFLAETGVSVTIDENKYINAKSAEQAVRNLFGEMKRNYSHGRPSRKTLFYNDLPVDLEVLDEQRVITTVNSPIAPDFKLAQMTCAPTRLMSEVREKVGSVILHTPVQLGERLAINRRAVAALEQELGDSTVWDKTALETAEQKLAALDAELIAESSSKAGRRGNQGRMDFMDAPTPRVPNRMEPVEVPEGAARFQRETAAR